MDLSRRTLIKAGGLGVAALGTGRAFAAAERPVQTVTLTGTAVGLGYYLYHPFTVPPGVNRLDVAIVKDAPGATGLGIFDPRGSHYATLERPNGFRGIYGEERGEFFLATDSASDAFLPGPISPGQWTIVVPVFNCQQPVDYTITVRMSAVPQGRPFVLGKDVELVLDEPGWYRGDLHAHTPASSDAFKSGSALSPRAWGDECRRIGLDFLALTDHNVVSQNFALADDAGDDVLLMAGEEMTNWFHGHATVSGMRPDDWFDWRQLPAAMLTPEALRDPRTGTIQEFLRAARASGAFVSAAHPLGATLAWRFFPDGAVDPAARTDALEVWTGSFQPDDQAAVRAWDAMNRQGQRVVANGGSDLHGVRNDQGFFAGTPTTVVHAEALSKTAVVAALKAGRSFITRTPSGVELYLSGTLPQQRAITGGTLYGDPTDLAAFEVLVRRGGGMRLVVLRDGEVVQVVPLTSDEQTVAFTSPVGAGGFVRVEVRGEPLLRPEAPLGSRLDMEAMTNPVWLVQGEPPAGTTPDTTQAPVRPGPRRGGVQAPAPTPTTAQAALPTTGAVALLGARVLTHSEFRLREEAGLLDGPLTLTGQVTRADADRAVLSRWVPGCCSSDAELQVEVRGVDLVPGQWYVVTGTAEGGRLAATGAELLPEPPARREV